MFNRNRLSAAIVTVLASAAGSSQVFAQDAQPVEEVIVTGIRASLERAMDIKRDSPGVVDAITSEDIGKFPDTNLAESLQRVTGVSIDRRNGEGFQVTVRGFGPEYNLVTLNGRTLPTTQLTLGKSTGGSPSARRAFDMSNIAAEGVAGVEVYKTGQANIDTGGIGATVNLKTRRPMDTEGFVANVGVKAIYDESNRAYEDVTPELTSFLSWSDEMFGASLAYTYQERNSGETGVFTNGYAAYNGPWTDASFIEGIPYTPEPGSGDPAIPVGAVDLHGSAPVAGQQTNMTAGIRYYHGDRQRTRENAQITLQYRPTDRVTATLDYTYAEQDIFVNSAELSFWFGGGTFPATDVQFDGNTQVATPLRYWAENPSGEVRDIGVTQNQGHVNNRLKSTGINVEFLATDELTLTFDAHHTTSQSLPPPGAVGDYFNIALGAQGVWAQGYDNSGDLPLLIGVYEDDHKDNVEGEEPDYGFEEDALDVGDLGSTVRQGWYSRAWNETDQIKLDGVWEFNNSASIDFGMSYSSMEATQKQSSFQEVLEGNWGVGTPGDAPPYMLEELDYAELFDGYSTTLSPTSREWFDGAGIDAADPSGAQGEVFTTGWIAKDVAELGKLLSFNAGLPWAPNPNDGVNRTIKEDITALYVQGSYELEVADMPLYLQAGLRYEETDVESSGQVGITTIVWQGDSDLITNEGNASLAPVIEGSGSYDNLLPSISASLDVTDDIKVRAAYSKTIARASYNNLLRGVNGIGAPPNGPTGLGNPPGTAQDGNPGLNPLESNNYDLSVEWYYDDASYASIGYFYKDVPNFVGTEVTEDYEIEGVLDPTAGPRIDEAIAELEDRDLPITQQNLFRMVASLSEEGVGCVSIYGEGENASNSASCGDDFDAWPYEETQGWEDNIDITATEGQPNYRATLNTPIDTQSAKLDGWEFAVQHFFGDTGFGVQANYTLVDGDIEYDVTSRLNQFALTGLSDSANLIGIYENDDFSARIAYNWRDNFLVTATDGGNNQPRFTEDYSQVDMNVSWYATDALTLTFEAINLTGEDQRDYGRSLNQPLRVDILHPRYALSARYTF